MDKLKADLDKLIDELKNSEEFREQLDNLISVYPFNEYEYIISTLLGFGILTIDDYYELRDEYISRNRIFSKSRGKSLRLPAGAGAGPAPTPRY